MNIEEDLTKATHSMMFASGSLGDASKSATGAMRDAIEQMQADAIALQRRIEETLAACQHRS